MFQLEDEDEDEDVISSLISAVREGRLERARELINSYGLSYTKKWSGGYVLLRDALRNNHAEVAKLLLTRGSRVNRIGENTPLHYAIRNGDIKIVKMILARGAKIDAKSYDGRTPLHFAVINGDIEIIKLILGRGANIDAKNQCGSTPLHDAIINCCKMKVIKLLLKHKADVNALDADGESPLHVAAEIAHLQIVEQLLNDGAYVNCVAHDSISHPGYTPLHFAVNRGDEEVVKLLLNRGADINASTKDKLTPLHIATIESHETVVKLLLQHGAKVDSQDKYCKTILHLAVEKGNVTIVKEVLKYCPDFNACDEYGRTALHYTALSKYNSNFLNFTGKYPDPDINIKGEIAKLLLSKGANVDAQTKGGETPLHYAVQKGYAKVVEALLEYNANVDSGVRTPLHLSAQSGHIEISIILLNKGANVNAKQEDGTTALQIATQYGHEEVVKVLLECGADVNCRDEHGRTALHIASQEGHDKIVVTLLEYGSDINVTSRNNHTPLDHAMAGISRRHLNSYRFEKIAESLKRHVAKMKTANLYVSEKNLLSMSSSGDELNDFKDECEKEIASMKSEKMNNLITSFYDILAKGTSSLAIYMQNENIVQVLKSDNYKTKFPIYASMIESNFRKGMERKKLLKQGYKIFHLLFNNFPKLPYNCTEKIFKYLSDADLRILMDACKPLGICNPN